jgi:hypothetical protein
MIDMIVVVAPFIAPFGMLTFLVNMINTPITILFIWLKEFSFNHGSMCLIFVALVFIFSWYISMIENCLCKKMLLYSSTFVLCVQIIVVVAYIVECIFCLFTKHYYKIP